MLQELCEPFLIIIGSEFYYSGFFFTALNAGENDPNLAMILKFTNSGVKRLGRSGSCGRHALRMVQAKHPADLAIWDNQHFAK